MLPAHLQGQAAYRIRRVETKAAGARLGPHQQDAPRVAVGAIILLSWLPTWLIGRVGIGPTTPGLKVRC